ncbi:hypothetical protein E2C01_038372 [Portunus trituberculatus]|uniref:Uncharacterized protein n=1 Tax=Portunus trituberculatus TaxID=210409 RepID=A0A5B7FHT6_PORTR|nr:hypothetical protein [Portunus trituberculatus]
MSQRTIICFGLDELVYRNPAETIAEEVGLRHGWAKVDSVYKFPRSSTVKIIFKDADMAKRTLLEVLNLFHIHIPGYQTRQEDFILLLTCNKCNAAQVALAPAPSGPATPNLSKSLSGLLCVFNAQMANMYNPAWPRMGSQT